MENRSKSKVGGLLVGAGGLSVFLALICCGFTWILAGLFAAFGLSFLLHDSVLITVILLGIIVAIFGWRLSKR